MNFLLAFITSSIASTQAIDVLSNEGIKANVNVGDDIQVKASVGNGLQVNADVNNGNQNNVVKPPVHAFPVVPPTVHTYPTVPPAVRTYPIVLPAVQTYPIVPPAVHTYPTVPPSNINNQIPSNCREGAMMCMNQMPGFYTCIGTKMVYRDCALGTKCRPSGQELIVCDY